MKASITAKEIMESQVVTVSPDNTLNEVWAKLSQYRISGAPVVDSEGSLLGVISQTDLLNEAPLSGLDRLPAGTYYIGAPFWENDDISEVLAQLGDVLVEEAMSPNVLTVAPDDDIAAVAVMMRRQHVHRIIVTEGRKVVGIITALDLIQLLERQ